MDFDLSAGVLIIFILIVLLGVFRYLYGYRVLPSYTKCDCDCGCVLDDTMVLIESYIIHDNKYKNITTIKCDSCNTISYWRFDTFETEKCDNALYSYYKDLLNGRVDALGSL